VTPFPNELMARLGPKTRNGLLALGETAQLTLSQVLGEAGDRVRHVYFPLAGFISLVAVVNDSPGIEVGMVGTEGMLGASLALGVSTHPVRAVVQGSGTAWRIPAPGFKAELARSPRLRLAVSRYLYVLLCQQASSAVCLRFHLIGPRLARWLLMSQDRAHSTRFRLTHEFVAYMMGVRRVGITQAAGACTGRASSPTRAGKCISRIAQDWKRRHAAATTRSGRSMRTSSDDGRSAPHNAVFAGSSRSYSFLTTA
jgi:CRP-like cAMP-binding protein